MEYFSEDEIDDAANDIINQLKNQTKSLKNVEREYPELSPEEVDSFVLKYGSIAVIELADALKSQSDIVRQTGDDKQVIALAELAKSFQGNLEVLQKRSIADNKNQTSIKIKEMDIESKKESQEREEHHRITMSREELFKIMIQQKLADKQAKEEKSSDDVIDI
jgi:hypothetical protein